MDRTHEERLRHWNDEFFGGKLPEHKLAVLEDVGDFHQPVIDFIEGVLRRIHSIGMSPEDFSDLLAWEMGFLLPRILPTAWGGMVPPITVAGRHQKLEEYLSQNPWHELAPGGKILDIGCGFPPLTTVDLARRFPECEVLGADPQFGRWIVYDVQGDYCCFGDDGDIRYFQAAEADYDRFDELLRGGQVTRDNYKEILDDLLPLLNGAAGHAKVERDGRRLVQDPIEQYVGDNLSFVLGGFRELDLPHELDLVRSMNVLMYFDADFRAPVEEWIASILKEGGIFTCGMNWARSVYSRYSVFRKEDGHLVHKEFSFGLECVRPLEMVPFFAFYDDDVETELQLELVRVLRADDDFMALLNKRFDTAQAELDLCPRGADGHLGGIDETMAFKDMEEALVSFQKMANSDELNDAARKVLEAAGYDVWRNEVGDTSITPRG